MMQWLKRFRLRSDPTSLEGNSTAVPAAVPADAEAEKKRADDLFDAGRLEEAIAVYRALLARSPGFARAWNNFGLCLRLTGRSAEAEQAFRSAVSQAPDLVAAWINLASMQEEARRVPDAVESLRRALTLDPKSRDARNNAGQLLSEQGQFFAAEEQFRAGLASHPTDAGLSFNLGLTLTRQGRIDDAVTRIRDAFQAEPDSRMVASAILMTLNYADDVAPSDMRSEHDRIARYLEAGAVPSLPGRTPPDSSRPLKVGYFSADLGYHVVSFFMEPVLASHDPGAVEVYCYYAGLKEDAQCEKLKAFGVRWRNVAAMDEDSLHRAVLTDGLDVAVDLSGHTGGNRLAVFARRVAPVQVTWLGYPNTTGLTAMDYRLTDIWADPPGMTEAWHSERLWRLPEGFLVYRPRPEAPEVNPLPRDTNGYVTYGCFNNFAKVSPTTLRLWAGVLAAVPDAKLIVKSKGLDEPAFATEVKERFARAGGDVSRLQLEGQQAAFENHLSRYGAIDIALDTYPYGGTTTTCEALWMGVPVVTLAGEVHAARVGASLLHRIGHPEWIAATEADFIRVARDLAQSGAALAGTRASLRAQMAGSSLTDARRFTRTLEEAFVAMARGELPP
jgi:predicted O-linked N-acetylglucosamine transferase (SPINDLY family)